MSTPSFPGSHYRFAGFLLAPIRDNETMTGTQLPVQIHGNPFRGEPQEDVFLCAAERWRGSANVFDVIGRRPARTVSIVEEVSRKAIRRDPFSSPGAFNPGDRA